VVSFQSLIDMWLEHKLVVVDWWTFRFM